MKNRDAVRGEQAIRCALKLLIDVTDKRIDEKDGQSCMTCSIEEFGQLSGKYVSASYSAESVGQIERASASMNIANGIANACMAIQHVRNLAKQSEEHPAQSAGE